MKQIGLWCKVDSVSKIWLAAFIWVMITCFDFNWVMELQIKTCDLSQANRKIIHIKPCNRPPLLISVRSLSFHPTILSFHFQQTCRRKSMFNQPSCLQISYNSFLAVSKGVSISCRRHFLVLKTAQKQMLFLSAFPRLAFLANFLIHR